LPSSSVSLIELVLAAVGAAPRGAEITSNMANSVRLEAAGSGKMPLRQVIGRCDGQLSDF
jgi:hypothetical protein